MSNKTPKNQESHNDFNDHHNINHQNFHTPPRKSPWGDIFLGIGLSILLVLAMVATLYIGKVGIASFIILFLISCSTFLSVRFIKRKRPIVGKILLSTIIPLTLLLLLFGACFASLGVL